MRQRRVVGIGTPEQAQKVMASLMQVAKAFDDLGVALGKAALPLANFAHSAREVEKKNAPRT